MWCTHLGNRRVFPLTYNTLTELELHSSELLKMDTLGYPIDWELTVNDWVASVFFLGCFSFLSLVCPPYGETHGDWFIPIAMLFLYSVFPTQQTVIDLLHIANITGQIIAQMFYIHFIAQTAGKKNKLFSTKGRDGYILGIAAHDP